MKLSRSVADLSVPLLLLSGQAAAQNKPNLEVSVIKKVTDPSQGGFRPFVEFFVAGQVLTGLLDTGSSDWTMPRTGSEFCKSAGEQCDAGFRTGSFDLKKAGMLARDLQEPFQASYTGGASFGGTFIEAPLQVMAGGEPVTAKMGLVEWGGVPTGQVSFPVLGVGPVPGESSPNHYPNVPARFKDSGKTKANAFGLFLGDFRSPNGGSVVWGGYDAAKFDGELRPAPLVKNNNGEISSFVVDLSSIRLVASNGSEKAAPGSHGGHEPRVGRKQPAVSSRPEQETVSTAEGDSKPPTFARNPLGRPKNAASYEHKRSDLSAKAIFRRAVSGNLLTNDAPPVVILDTGVPQIIVPEATLKQLGTMLNAAPPGPLGEFVVDCGRVGGMDLVFGMNKDAIQIRVPLDSILAPNVSPAGQTAAGSGSGYCSLLLGAVTAQGGGTAVLGAPALQHMYVVFDMDSEALLMAQAKANETRVDIKEYIPAGRQ
ncbi:hypothetical protein E4U41_006450 [Claviceps citrina]|nr:hypothetical protein E4U41_006450 [Claviceps citrina]